MLKTETNCPREKQIGYSHLKHFIRPHCKIFHLLVYIFAVRVSDAENHVLMLIKDVS